MISQIDIDNFPFDRRDSSVWYFIVDWENKTEKDFCSVQDKKNLLVDLFQIITERKNKNFQLYGVWHGQYRTDIFKIPIEAGHQKIEKYFSK